MGCARPVTMETREAKRSLKPFSSRRQFSLHREKSEPLNVGFKKGIDAGALVSRRRTLYWILEKQGPSPESVVTTSCPCLCGSVSPRAWSPSGDPIRAGGGHPSPEPLGLSEQGSVGGDPLPQKNTRGFPVSLQRETRQRQLCGRPSPV